jgi:hypothetical protein
VVHGFFTPGPFGAHAVHRLQSGGGKDEQGAATATAGWVFSGQHGRTAALASLPLTMITCRPRRV